MSMPTRWAALGVLGLGLIAGTVTPRGAFGATETELQSAVYRAKPAVVMVAVRLGGTASVRCSEGPAVTVKPAAIGELGSGSIVHPDGWIVTNGHVVQPYQEGRDGAFGAELLEKAITEACGPELQALTPAARVERIRALAAEPMNRDGLAVDRAITVNLSNGRAYPASLTYYSPPAYVRTGDGSMRGRDVAILKIEERELPVVRLAARSTDLHLGQSLFVIGFPGVVASHELLSKATLFEPTITTGRVSGFKEDVGGQRVIQTDAAIIQGNSGGPVFDDRGYVVGAATFTSLQGDQVVQGFNFAIPVETIHEAARQAGFTPLGDSMFTRLWNHGVDLYVRDLHFRAYRNMSAANRIHPGFPDVERVREDCDIKHREQGYLHREEVQWGIEAVALVGGLALVWFGGRWLAAATRRNLRRIIREELAGAHAEPRGIRQPPPRTKPAPPDGSAAGPSGVGCGRTPPPAPRV